MLDKIRGVIRSRFARDAAMLQIASVVNTVANLATSFVLFRSLGPHEYGTYSEAFSLYTLLYFLTNVGFLQLTTARLSEALGRRDPEIVVRWLGFFVKAYGVFATGLLVAGFVAAPWLGEWILGERETGWWAAVLCASGLLSLPFYMVQCALQGTRRMRILAEMENLKEILRAFWVVGFTLAVGDARGAILGEVAGAAMSAPLAWLAYWKGHADPGLPLPRVRQVWHAAVATSWKEVGALAKKGAMVSISKNFTAIFPIALPRLVLAHYGTPREVGYLNLGQNLMRLPLIGLQGVSRTLMPVLGQMRGAGAADQMHGFLGRITFFSGAIIALATGLFGLAMVWFIPFFYGEPARPVLPLLPWLFVAMVIAGFAVAVEAFLVVLDRLHIGLGINLAAACLLVPAGFWIIRAFHAPGAAAFIALVHVPALLSTLYVLSVARKMTRDRSDEPEPVDPAASPPF